MSTDKKFDGDWKSESIALREEIAELKAENERLHIIRDECDERGIDIDILVKECGLLKRQLAEYKADAERWKLASTSRNFGITSWSEFGQRTSYAVVATQMIDAALAATKGES